MPQFRYKATDPAGATTEGVIEAADQDAVLERLRASERLPIRVDELAQNTGRFDTRLWRGIGAALSRPILQRPPLSRRTVANLSREIATLLAAGLPLTRALSVAAKAASAPKVTQVLSRLLTRVQSGAALSSAMASEPAVFDGFYVSMVRAGEASGDLAGVLERLYREQSRIEDAKDAIRSALAYPIILLFVACLSVIVLLVFVLPQFEVLFRESGADLPLVTRVVIGLAGFLRTFGWLILVVIALGWIAVRVGLRDAGFRRRWHLGLLSTPILGSLLTRIELQRYSASLAMLLQGGVHLPEALAKAHESVGNLALKQALNTAADQVRHGDALAEALHRQGCIPARAVELIRIGEEVGELATMIERTAELYERETAAVMRRFVTLIEPALILVIGLIVAGLVFSVLSAIVGINALVI